MKTPQHFKSGSGMETAIANEELLTIEIMGFTKDQEKMLGRAGYTKSQLDSNKWINGSHSAKASEGGSVTWNTDSHTRNGAGMSNTLFGKKTK